MAWFRRIFASATSPSPGSDRIGSSVTGVSRKGQSHGANVIYQRLRQRGYQVFAVNPNADEVEGDPCYHDLKSIPGGVDWVVIGTKPETANATVRECRELGIKRVWDAPVAVWARQHFRVGSRLRTRARHDCHPGRLPVHVRPHR